MIKMQARIYLKAPFDDYAIDDAIDNFVEADYTYGSNYIKFYGTPERLQEAIRAIKTVATVENVKQY